MVRSVRRLCLAFVIVGAVAGCSRAARQEAPDSPRAVAVHDAPWVMLRLGDASAIDPATFSLHEDGAEYLCVTKGAPSTAPRLAEEGDGRRTLRIALGPTAGPGPDHGRDKINYRIVDGHAPRAPRPGGPMVYFAFSVELDRDAFEAPTEGRGYVIAQWWQGAPFGPPVSVELLPAARATDDPEVAFRVRNSETGGNPSARTIELRPTPPLRLARGRWVRFVVGARFGSHDDGELRAWIDGSRAEVVSWKGSIGYDPQQIGSSLGFPSGLEADRRPNDAFELYIGPYRDRMQSTQVYAFDRVAYGPSRESVE